MGATREKNLVDQRSTLPHRREHGRLILSVAEDGHLTILADLQSDAMLRPEQGSTSSCSLGGCSPSSRLEDTADSPNNSVLINDDRAVERCGIARELRREITQGAADEQVRIERIDRRKVRLPAPDKTFDHLL